MELLSKLGEQALLAVVPILAVALVGWLLAQAKLAWAKAKDYAPDLADAVEEAARIAVKSAEQSAKLNDFVGTKKDYALTIAEDWLAMQGIKVDLHLIEAAIEKAVLENFPHETSPDTAQQ